MYYLKWLNNILLLGVLLQTPSERSVTTEWELDCFGMSIVPFSGKVPRLVDTCSLYEIITEVKPGYSRKDLFGYLTKNQLLERSYIYYFRTGILPSVLVAHAILESGLGTSSLTKVTKNEGNVKCKCSWNSKLRKKHEGKGICVQAYDKIEQSNDYYVITDTYWKAWSLKIEKLVKHASIREAKYKELTTNEWCKLIHSTPYATDEQYDKKLIRIIESYNLQQLDNHAYNVIQSPSGTYTIYDGKAYQHRYIK